MKFYSEEFKKIREQKGMSIAQLIEIIGCSRVSIWLWENGKKIPSENKIKAIARALHTKLSSISDLPDDPKRVDDDIVPIFNIIDRTNIFGFGKELEKIENTVKYMTEITEVLKNCTLVMNVLLKFTIAAIYIKNTQNIFVLCNNLCADLFKIKSNECVSGLNDFDVMMYKEADANSKEDEELLKTGKELKKEGYIPNTAKKRWGIIRKNVIVDNKGNILGLMCSILDITEQKEANELRELLELNVRHMTTGIAIIDLKTHKVLYVNSAYEKIYGASAEKIYKGGFKFMCSLIHEDDVNMIYNSMNPNEFVENLKFKLKREIDGKPIWIKATRTKGTFKDRTCSISSSRFMDDELFTL